MSDHHGNDHHGPLRLSLTEEERESARDVIATLLDEVDELGGGLLARVWKAHAQELCELCLTDPEPEESAIPCACCAEPADGIGDFGLALCSRCANDPIDRERDAIAHGPGGIRELEALYTDHGGGPVLVPSREWWALYWKAPTVEAVKQLAREDGLTSIHGIGPKRATKIEEALSLHASGVREGREPS